MAFWTVYLIIVPIPYLNGTIVLFDLIYGLVAHNGKSKTVEFSTQVAQCIIYISTI